jgi:hypothetical protein
VRDLQGIAYRHEPAQQPDPVLAGRRGRAEQALRYSQPLGHVLEPAVHLESSDKALARPHLTPADIGGQQNPRIGFDLCLQRGDGFPVKANGQYGRLYRAIMKKIIGPG